MTEILTESVLRVYKNLGETPLECLERIRRGKNIPTHIPMTYAGRLDPMAEGELILLVGDECKNKEKYLGLDKWYEAEVLIGVTTDTYDVLGFVQDCATSVEKDQLSVSMSEISTEEFIKVLSRHKGKFLQEYPAYSSKTFEGIQLHTRAREGTLPENLPTKEVEMYSLELLESFILEKESLHKRVVENICLVNGNFRQKECIEAWNDFFSKNRTEKFQVFRIRVYCSSGTYIRSLAHTLGQELGTGALALSIKRTKVCF